MSLHRSLYFFLFVSPLILRIAWYGAVCSAFFLLADRKVSVLFPRSYTGLTDCFYFSLEVFGRSDSSGTFFLFAFFKFTGTYYLWSEKWRSEMITISCLTNFLFLKLLISIRRYQFFLFVQGNSVLFSSKNAMMSAFMKDIKERTSSPAKDFSLEDIFATQNPNPDPETDFNSDPIGFTKLLLGYFASVNLLPCFLQSLVIVIRARIWQTLKVVS